MILIYIIIALFVPYFFLIIFYWQAWISIPEYKLSENKQLIKISIIIPARNEEENISTLLEALQKQTYPSSLFEIIVVDDHSTDKTSEIVQQFSNISLIQLKEDNINSYKKKAIETGIAAATGQLTPDKERCEFFIPTRPVKPAAHMSVGIPSYN